MKNFWLHKIKDPILKLLKEGLTPEDLAKALSLGVMVGVIPLLGTTMILCALLAKLLRLNQVAIQIANYVVYPLQFILLIPFIRLGEKIWMAGPVALDIPRMTEMFTKTPNLFFQQFAMSAVHGFTAWLICLVPIYLILNWILKRILIKSLKKA